MTLEQINGGKFRVYRYDPGDGSEPVDLLSVTSIRDLCGISYNLVSWQLANLADAALGTMKRTVIGPRGGVSEKRMVWEYPSEFAVKYDATLGEQAKIDTLRTWLREQAEEPRNIAGIRGTLVHEAIEKNVAWDRIERPYLEAGVAGMSPKDRKRMKKGISDEDVSFVRNGTRQYWDMRRNVPMLILSREVRVVNLTAGYAGTFDALVWMLGDFDADGKFTPLPPERMAEALALRGQQVAKADIDRIGGTIVLLDWKTSNDLHTDQVVQDHAYLAAEFAVTNGVRDERVTLLMNAAMWGGLAHIRPNGWGVHLFPYESEAVRAFLGSVAFARYIAKYPEPGSIFTHVMRGASKEIDEEVAQ